MPSRKGLAMLIRQNPLSEEEWLALIEARRELIKPNLDRFTLPELGELSCLKSEGHFLHPIRHDISDTIGDSRFSLKTQGLFFAQPYTAVARDPKTGFTTFRGGYGCPSGTMKVWGLTRANQWVLATIAFRGEAGYKDRGYERATSVEIAESDLPAIVAATKEEPKRIWRFLGEAVKSWADQRRVLFEHAFNLARLVMVEEELAFSISVGE